MGGSCSCCRPRPPPKKNPPHRKALKYASSSLRRPFFPGTQPDGVCCFELNHPYLEDQTQSILKKPILPFGIEDITLVHAEIVPIYDRMPCITATREVLKRGHAECLIRAYAALIDPRSPSPLNPGGSKDLLAPPTLETGSEDGSTSTKNGVLTLTRKEVLLHLHLLMRGVRLLEAAGSDNTTAPSAPPPENLLQDEPSPSFLRPSMPPADYRRLVLRMDPSAPGRPATINLSPTRVRFVPTGLPADFSLGDLRAQPVHFHRVSFDLMLQVLWEHFDNMEASCPHHPRERRVQFASTEDVVNFAMPIVHAVLPNNWITSPFHQKVLTILTMFKLLKVRDEALREIEEAGWPRDLNAKGNSTFPHGTGSDRVHRQCGVRLHMGDPECSRAAVNGLSPEELKGLFGKEKGKDFRVTLTEPEKRHVMKVLDYPYLLLLAFLHSLRSALVGEDGQIPTPSHPVPLRFFCQGNLVTPEVPDSQSVCSMSTLDVTSPRNASDAELTRLGAAQASHASLPGSTATVQMEAGSVGREGSYEQEEALMKLSVLKMGGFCRTALPKPVEGVPPGDREKSVANIGRLFDAMATVSCLNLRFFDLMVATQGALGIQSAGEQVMEAYKQLSEGSEEDFDTKSLEQATQAVRAWFGPTPVDWEPIQEDELLPGGGRLGMVWDPDSGTFLPVTDSQIKEALFHLGFSPGASAPAT